MTDQQPHPTADGLDALISALLDCGGPLSQMMSSMYESDRSGRSSPDAPPPLEIAHTLIRDVSAAVSERHSDEQLRVSAEIVDQITAAICENIFIVPPSEIERMRHRSRATHSTPRRRRNGRRTR